MKKLLYVIAACWFIPAIGTAAVLQASSVRTFILDPRMVEAVRASITGGSKDYAAAAKALRKEADKALEVTPVSVVEKKQLPPSGDKHDYMSMGKYWWPDPKTAGGLPYIRRDGEVNPEAAARSDEAALNKMIKSVAVLSYASYYLGEQRYADHAAAFLRTWFLNPQTRMNPNLDYAQSVPGRNDGRGSGIIDAHQITILIDALGLLGEAPSLTLQEREGLTAWFREYLRWLRESKNGRQEAKAKNNHGTWYDVQVVSIALFVGDNELARTVLTASRELRIASQIEPDGTQPQELARTRSFGYSMFNLMAMTNLAVLGERAGVDLWRYQTNDGRSIRKALDHLLPYVSGDKKWEGEQIAEAKLSDAYSPFLNAARAYQDAKYAAAASQIPDAQKLAQRSLLMGPVVSDAGQKNTDVHTVPGLLTALNNARPGSQIMLADGEYDLNGEIAITSRGVKGNPIRIAAKHRGKAVIVGASHFIFTNAGHIVIEGLNFKSLNGPAIELRGSEYIQITRNTFHLNETQRGSWILIDGIKGDSVTISGHNRIDHNLFEKKSQLGNFITIEGTLRAHPQISQYDRIDHNLFAEIGPRVENVLEAIRAGSSTYSLSSGFTVIEENLFERCDGDPEYLSIKTSDDTIRNNTFRECLGSLSLRHGNRNTVEGNYILGGGRTGSFLDSTGKTWKLGTGGVRFYGNGMRIVNNYFEGLTGSRWDATLAITSGNAVYGDGQPLTKHFQINDATISGNLLVNNVSNIEIGYDGGGFQGNWWRLPPAGLRIANNIVTGSVDTLIHIFTQPINAAWEQNIVWPSGKAVAASSPIAGVRVEDPKLVKAGGIWQVPGHTVRLLPLTRNDVGPDAK